MAKNNTSDELIIANKELFIQNEEKEKLAAELILADKELAFQKEEKKKRAAELIIADKELAFQNEEKEKRAAELIIANKELVFQNREKERRADELIIANKELAFQNKEKEKRADELIVVNKELAFQNKEKEKRADELSIANKELAFQNREKEKRAAELIIADKELEFQNEEKGKRAEELILANKELVFQNKEKGKRATELSENKTLLASVLDSSLSGIMAFKSIRNAEGAIMDFEWQLVNAAAEQMVSHSQTEILGKRLLEEMPGNRVEGLFDLYVQVVETGIPLSHEHYYEHEKVKTWFHTVAIKRLDGFVVTFSNITERKLFEQELILANKELAFQNDEKGKRADELVIANKELAFQNNEKEKRADELIIANKELAFQNDEKEKRADELVIANKELTFQNNEKEKRADELIIANKELAFQNEEKGKRADELVIANIELAFQNEEKEKRAAELIIVNEERRETNEYLENLINYANAPIIVWNTHYQITRFNRAFEILTGRTEKEVLGKSLEILFPPAQKDSSMELIRKTLVGARMEIVEINILHIDGSVRILLWNSANIISPNGKTPIATIAQGNDITIRKLAEEEIKELNETLEQNVIERTKQLENANKELEAFSYSVSHDLRAPLRHVGGFVDLLVKNNSVQLDESGLRYLKIISESSHEMGDLIDALLTFSRLGRTELQRTKIDSKNMVARIVKTFSNEIVGRNVEINISELPDAMGDETLINQVWVNLISNAIKYSRNKEKAVIDIGGKIENGKTIFQIRDNGAGFDMKYADKLFGVFQRLHKARDFEGIGIGLANVNRIIVRHGGKCWAESEVDNGATFSFSVPNN